MPVKVLGRAYYDIPGITDQNTLAEFWNHPTPPDKELFMCRNQQCCLHFWLLLEDPFEQLSGIVKNVDRHGKPALFLIMQNSCLRIIQAKTKAVRRRKKCK